MSMFVLGPITFDTGAGSQTLNTNLDSGDLSSCTSIYAIVRCTKADTDATDTCDVYLQSRDQGGFWRDRIHFGAQGAANTLIGSMSPTTADPEIRDGYLQQYGTLTDSEESDEPSGSAGASRLAVATVRNGGFPGLYRDVTGMLPAWRIQAVVVEASTSNADFEFTVELHCSSELS